MSTAAKNVVVELKKGLKLKRDNYETWSLKVQFVLEEQEALEENNIVMDEPKGDTTAQHRHDRAAYDAWKKKHSLGRITLLSTLDDNILREFKDHQRAMGLWVALKNRFGTYSTARLRSLAIKFDSHKKRPEHSVKTHLRHMTNMTGELKYVGHVLTDEQQIQVIIRSLLNSWDHMKMKMQLTQNQLVTSLEDVRRHLELEEDRLEATKTIAELHMTTSSKAKGDSKRNNWGKKKGSTQSQPTKRARIKQQGNNKHPKRVNIAKTKLNDLIVTKKGHYA